MQTSFPATAPLLCSLRQDTLVLLGTAPPFPPGEVTSLASCPFSPPWQGHQDAQQPCPVRSGHTLLSRDSKASEVEDLELFMPEEAAGRGRAWSVPWLPTLMPGLQGLAALLMVSWRVRLSAEEQKRRAHGSTA